MTQPIDRYQPQTGRRIRESGELYRQTFSFPKGSVVERGILFALPSDYTVGTWEANGGKVYIRSDANLSICAISFNFDRSHKAR